MSLNLSGTLETNITILNFFSTPLFLVWCYRCYLISLRFIVLNNTTDKSKTASPTLVRTELSDSRRLYDINCSKIFFGPPPRVMKMKTKINKWNLNKIFCIAKEIINKKTTLRIGETIGYQSNWQETNL